MTQNEFNKFVEKQLNNISSVLVKKTDEYNLEEDRLGFFKRAGALSGESAAKALLGMMTKHIVSIYDMVNSGKKYSNEAWLEKCGDAQNYLMLLAALEYEFNEQQENGKCQ